MNAYRNEAPLTILSLDYVELSITPEEFGIESDEPYHMVGGEFFYCGLAVDGKVLVSEKELNILLPLLDAQVHHVSANIMYINCRSDNSMLIFNVRHVHTENIEDDEEDDEMIFVLKEQLDEAWVASL